MKKIASPRNCPRNCAAGFTLIELVTSMVVVSIVMTALASVVIVAGRAVPNGQTLTDAILMGGSAAGQITRDLRAAVYVLERTATSVKIVVADRTGDGVPDVIRYAWSGTAGTPLTCQVNAGTPAEVLSNVAQMSFEYDVVNVVETYTGPIVEGAEETFASYNPTSLNSSQDFDVESDKWPGQYFSPTMPANAVSWRVTRVQFVAKVSVNPDQSMGVDLYPASSGGLPTGTRIERVTVPESQFSSSYSWQNINFTNAGNLAPGSGVCLILKNLSGSYNAGTVRWDNGANSYGGSGMISTSNSGSSYKYESNRSLQYYALGKITTQYPNQTITRPCVAGVRLTLQPTAQDGSLVNTAVRLLNKPEVLDGYWELDFSVNPTTVDVNGDTQADWATTNGSTFNTATLVSGAWQAGTTIQALPGNLFNQPVTVDVRCQDTTTGDPGPGLWMHLDFSGNSLAVVTMDVSLQSNGTQTFTLASGVSSTTMQTLLTVTGLPSGFVDARLLFDPVNDTVVVSVAGVNRGTLRYTRMTSSNPTPTLALFPWAGGAQFDSVRVRIGGTSP